MAEPIWISGWWLIGAWAFVSLAIHAPVTRGMGPADSAVMAVGTSLAAGVVVVLVLWALHAIGITFGLRG